MARPVPATKKHPVTATAPAAPWSSLWPGSRPTRWLLAAVIGVSLWLRLDSLASSIPMAGDENVFLRWAEIALHQNGWFVPLLDGKQPLNIWLHALSWMVWPDDPLWAGRLVSALAGVLSTLGIFAVGRRLSGDAAGLLAAVLYAVSPYALLYDRLAYTDSLVNLAGIAIVYASIAAFQAPNASWKRGLAPGLAVGLGYFAKSTALLFALFPLLAALLWGRSRGRKLLAPLAALYGVALLFPLLARIATPRAPMMPTHSVIVHQTRYFTSPREWIQNPLANAPGNLMFLGSYARAYVTLPLCAAAVAAAVYLFWRRAWAPLAVLAAASLLPLLAQVSLLKMMFPTRYPFPHVWPWFLALAVAAADLGGRHAALALRRARTLAGLAALGLALPVIVKGLGVVRNPAEFLHPEDAQTFLGSGPAAGFGLREAADFLINEARRGPLTLLTDPIWGPPADSMFVYLNERFGILVYEAWWTTISGTYPILPPTPVEIVRSQYERVAAGTLDPRALNRVFYVTERHYYTPEAVAVRQPSARLIATFFKPNQRNAIDVYRLK